ncbi:hypothetical protein HH303_17215 [Rhodospirillaceae bacterium KN72]|uniref:Thioesterase n=1 Tax=Pacificispira spongiicola TaxID=2729598 RepID=A0A7Y0E2W0_9PROT|nr:thioesterase family protein [Pacificispira spongiicola]NMM46234.1 hypothetical protein [Pacificispira spongiicola]
MPTRPVAGDFIDPSEEGLFDQDGLATGFFYYRQCDLASDVFFDDIGMGVRERHALQRSNFAATASLEIFNPVRHGESVTFDVSVIRVGTKSMTYRIRMNSVGDGALRAVVESVGVCMDMAAGRPMALPDEVKARIQAYLE